MFWDRFGKQYIQQSAPSCSVRLQYCGADADLPSVIETAAIWKKIKNAQDELARAADSGASSDADSTNDVSLHVRFWKETSPPKNAGAVSGSEGVAPKDDDASKSSFTVAQFNTLARGLSSGPADLFPTPFPKENSYDSNYGGFTAVENPEVVLDFDRFRKWRLLHVLLGGGLRDGSGSTPLDHDLRPAFDIIALEEVDEYNSFFRQVLVKDDGVRNQSSTMGDEYRLNCYQGVFQPKPKSPCIPLGWYSDGVALLWNSDKFHAIAGPSNAELVEKGSFRGRVDASGNITGGTTFSYQNQVYVIVPLQIKGTDKCVVVAATHLKAKKGAVNDQIRKVQASELRHRAEQKAKRLNEQGWKDVSILIVGDFNSEPSDASVGCILSRDESDDAEKSWDFQSAYPLREEGPSPGSGLYTTWKTRRDGTTRRIIDYIFYASNKTGIQVEEGIGCTHFLSVPKDGEVEHGGFPGYRYPSDHVLIGAKFQY